MADPFTGEVRSFGFSFPPRDWAHCNGGTMEVSSNTALFALLGTIYGGDGRTTFGIPDLRGRVALGFGHGPGLRNYAIGQHGGDETITLTTNTMPSHNHNIQAASDITHNAPDNHVVGARPVYNDPSHANVTLHSDTIGNTGSGTPMNNQQPYLGLNFCICLVGLFPQRS